MYRTSKGATPIRVLLEGGSAWLTQRLIADLYGTSIPNLNQHTPANYGQGELRPEATLKKYLMVQSEGKRQVKRLYVDDLKASAKLPGDARRRAGEKVEGWDVRGRT